MIPKLCLADEPTGNLDAVNEEIVLRLLRELHRSGRTIVMVTHDPVVARLADRRIELHHGKIAAQEVFAMADEEQFDEVLEELWALEEHGQIAETGRMEVHGALPVSIAIEKMTALGLVTTSLHNAPIPCFQAFCESVPRCFEADWRFYWRRKHDCRTHLARTATRRRRDSPPSSCRTPFHRQPGARQRI